MILQPWPRDLGPVICVVGARPNFMKMAPILRAFAGHLPAIPTVLVHTGQHYDKDMNDKLFDDLKLPKPDINLGVGSGSHTVQTAEVMRHFEPVVDEYKPSCVLVVGDVNSTLACSLVAAKKGIKVVHIEAGLRSYDRAMPEEINRLLTDQLADRLYTTELGAQDNLVREGIAAERVCFAGNVMIDSLLHNRSLARPVTQTLADAGLPTDLLDNKDGYAVVTLHRPSNVDQLATLQPLLKVLREISERLPIAFAIHPRTRANIERFGLMELMRSPRIALLPPQGYLEMLGLMSGAKLVLTDSGGLQEETTALGIPCLTLRENTERPITIEQGTNTLVGIDPKVIWQYVNEVLVQGGKSGRVPALWDGKAAERIADDLARWLMATVYP
ncbi:non-hydrolyzing UDP-N-acetylglucosamine 2-epimerase [Chitinimonas sp. PSY-7]|uniref:non-hydrolyzing UDP-N-acetylglucosamine 2-epimerase n=1 Tax=Chitinimonas sp. PSY-7 TaxID=3459088 RepID=UPI00403FDD38